MSGHTKGPWSVIKGTYGFDIAGPESERGRWLVGTTTGVSETDLANANMIAAATDMLAALKDIVARNEIQHWFNLDLARAAIAKAEAQTSGGGGG